MIDLLTEIQRELNHVDCPQCQKSRFDLALHCELNDHDCLYIARCLSCGHAFNISTETKNLLKIQPDIEKALSALRCHSCDKVGAELKFWCGLEHHTCLYVASCRHCGEFLHQYL